MPRPLPVVPMSISEFDAMPHQLGWKYEYWDGMARLSPQNSAIGEFRLPISRELPSHSSGAISIRAIRPSDRAALITLFRRAFDESTEFTGSSKQAFDACAEESVAQFFTAADDATLFAETASDEPLPVVSNACLIAVSQVAIQDNRIVGAAIIRAVRLGPIVEPVFIDPKYQRQGIATALLAAVLMKLRRLVHETDIKIDFLYSRCHLGNSESLAWHSKIGFEDLQSFPGLRHRWRHCVQQARHFRMLGDEVSAHRAQAEANQFAEIADELEQTSPQKLQGLLDR